MKKDLQFFLYFGNEEFRGIRHFLSFGETIENDVIMKNSDANQCNLIENSEELENLMKNLKKFSAYEVLDVFARADFDGFIQKLRQETSKNCKNIQSLLEKDNILIENFIEKILSLLDKCLIESRDINEKEKEFEKDSKKLLSLITKKKHNSQILLEKLQEIIDEINKSLNKIQSNLNHLCEFQQSLEKSSGVILKLLVLTINLINWIKMKKKEEYADKNNSKTHIFLLNMEALKSQVEQYQTILEKSQFSNDLQLYKTSKECSYLKILRISFF